MARDLTELFRIDPLELTRDDIKELIEAHRSLRHQFTLGNMKAAAKPKTEKAKALSGLGIQLDLTGFKK